jgi:hypothetical protein
VQIGDRIANPACVEVCERRAVEEVGAARLTFVLRPADDRLIIDLNGGIENFFYVFAWPDFGDRGIGLCRAAADYLRLPQLIGQR